jgi:23S rRNA-/tRNA-specific pseudouridylate synthase
MTERLLNRLNTNYHRWDIYQLEKPTTVEEYILNNSQNLQSPTLTEYAELGCFYTNGIRTDLKTLIKTPCKLEFYEPKHGVKELLSSYGVFDPKKHILYENDGIAVVFKPYRLHSLPAKEQNLVSLWHALTNHYKTKIHIPSRLDFSTAGLIVLSYLDTTHNFVQDLYAKRWLEKTYLFKSANQPSWDTFHCDKNLDKDPSHSILRKVVDTGGQSAITDFKVLKKYSDGSTLLSAHPYTGRTHQIRVHASYLGLPLIGDDFYGGKEASELHLLAYQLKFPTPKVGEKITIKVPDELLPSWVDSYDL